MSSHTEGQEVFANFGRLLVLVDESKRLKFMQIIVRSNSLNVCCTVCRPQVNIDFFAYKARGYSVFWQLLRIRGCLPGWTTHLSPKRKSRLPL